MRGIKTILTGGYELSGGARVKGGLLLADDELIGSVLFLPDPALESGGTPVRAHIVKIQRDREESAPHTDLPRLFAVQDFEGIASNGKKTVFLIGSHSPDPDKEVRQPDREFLIRAKWDYDKEQPQKSKLKDAVLAPSLLPMLGVDPNDLRGDLSLNIEGLAYDPDEELLYIGLRSPLGEGDTASVYVVSEDAVIGGDAADHAEQHALDLEGAGIRGLAWDKVHGVLLVLSGPKTDGPEPRPALWRYVPDTHGVTKLHDFTDDELDRVEGGTPRTPEGIIRMPDGKLAILMDPEGGDGGLLYLDLP